MCVHCTVTVLYGSFLGQDVDESGKVRTEGGNCRKVVIDEILETVQLYSFEMN